MAMAAKGTLRLTQNKRPFKEECKDRQITKNKYQRER